MAPSSDMPGSALGSAPGGTPVPQPASAPSTRGRTWAEITIVLALSLGASAVYSIVNILDRVTRDTALSEQAAEINRSLAERPGFDLTYQLLGILFGLAPVALVLWLTYQSAHPHFASIGLAAGGRYGRPVTRTWWLRDTGSGVLLALVIGVPGLALYVAARAVGLNTQVVTSGLGDYWWTIPVLVLAALKAALLEELIVVGYLFNRLGGLRWRPWAIILASAILRGSYHLYQGFGGFVGNIAMGIVFGWAYQRWGRILPLIIAHWMLDIVSFAGYAWAVAMWPGFF